MKVQKKKKQALPKPLLINPLIHEFRMSAIETDSDGEGRSTLVEVTTTISYDISSGREYKAMVNKKEAAAFAKFWQQVADALVAE